MAGADDGDCDDDTDILCWECSHNQEMEVRLPISDQETREQESHELLILLYFAPLRLQPGSGPASTKAVEGFRGHL